MVSAVMETPHPVGGPPNVVPKSWYKLKTGATSATLVAPVPRPKKHLLAKKGACGTTRLAGNNIDLAPHVSVVG